MESLIVPGIIALIFLTLITLLSLYNDSRHPVLSLISLKTVKLHEATCRLISRPRIDHLLASLIISKSFSYAKQI